MAEFDPQSLHVPEPLASAVDLDPRAVLAILGSAAAPSGYLTVLPRRDAEGRLEIWKNALERLASTGYRPVLYEPMADPGAYELLRDEPRVLSPARGLSITASTAEGRDDELTAVYRSADDLLGAAAGSDIEQTLTAPREDIDPDALADLDVPADELIQLPSGPTGSVDHAVPAGEPEEDGVGADTFLTYVRADDPAEALAHLYQANPGSSAGSIGETLAILRAWHRRFGAELLQVKAEAASLELWVERPPEADEDCYRLGQEVLAFWPQVVTLWNLGDHPGRLGRKLAGSRVWRFPG